MTDFGSALHWAQQAVGMSPRRSKLTDLAFAARINLRSLVNLLRSHCAARSFYLETTVARDLVHNAVINDPRVRKLHRLPQTFAQEIHGDLKLAFGEIRIGNRQAIFVGGVDNFRIVEPQVLRISFKLSSLSLFNRFVPSMSPMNKLRSAARLVCRISRATTKTDGGNG